MRKAIFPQAIPRLMCRLNLPCKRSAVPRGGTALSAKGRSAAQGRFVRQFCSYRQRRGGAGTTVPGEARGFEKHADQSLGIMMVEIQIF